MAIDSQLYARLFAVSCLAGAALSIAKTIRVFSLNPRELGSPRGAAEDWLLLTTVLLTASLSAWITQDIIDGLNWKPLVALAVVASVIVWLRLPVVRHRLKEGSAQ